MNIITSLCQKINDRKRISIMSQTTCNDLKGLSDSMIAFISENELFYFEDESVLSYEWHFYSLMLQKQVKQLHESHSRSH